MICNVYCKFKWYQKISLTREKNYNFYKLLWTFSLGYCLSYIVGFFFELYVIAMQENNSLGIYQWITLTWISPGSTGRILSHSHQRKKFVVSTRSLKAAVRSAFSTMAQTHLISVYSRMGEKTAWPFQASSYCHMVCFCNLILHNHFCPFSENSQQFQHHSSGGDTSATCYPCW